eukprot:766284-Hanusia_phi.AAC.1
MQGQERERGHELITETPMQGQERERGHELITRVGSSWWKQLRQGHRMRKWRMERRGEGIGHLVAGDSPGYRDMEYEQRKQT